MDQSPDEQIALMIGQRFMLEFTPAIALTLTHKIALSF